MTDKAIRAGELTTGGAMELARAATARSRAGAQIAPSHYLPGVPRAVHAAGGKVLYHGTGENYDIKDAIMPLHFTEDKEEAQDFAKNYDEGTPRVIKAHLKLNNPLRATSPFVDRNFNPINISDLKGGEIDLQNLRGEHLDYVRDAGYDGVVFPWGEHVALYPHVIREVRANGGSVEDNENFRSWFGNSVPRAVHAAGGKVLPPGYSVKVDPQRFGVLARYKGRNVGQLTLNRDRDTGKLTAFEMAVHPNHRRKGLMSAMHDAAEQAFGPMEPDQTLTDDGFAFWKGYRPSAVSNNLRFHADKLMGQTVKTPYGPGRVKSVGATGMNADLLDPDKAGSTGWARARDNEDVLRSVGIDPSTLSYANGGSVMDNENFRNWFGSSVTHTSGEPHVFYHGTSKDKDFTGFNVGRHGAWFTQDPQLASEYADQNDSQGMVYEGGRYRRTNTAGRVIPVYVKAENPYTGEYSGRITGNYKKDQSDWFDTLRAKGHDAWIPASSEGKLAVALKEPQQIKSVYNSGRFDPAQKHMGKAEGGEVENAQTPGENRPIGTQTEGLLGSGGVRGGLGVLQAPVQAPRQGDLIGLPTNVKLPKLGASVVAGHNPAIRKVAEDYARSTGIDYNPPKVYQKVDPKRAARIADAYEAMAHDPSHPLVRASYDALMRETLAQYQAMKRAGMKLEFYPDPANDPYKSNPRLAIEDVNKNNHMYVYPTDAGYGTGEALPGAEENPMLKDSGERWNGKPVLFNDLFRAVHDYFGHAKEGVGFRADGEENAWRSHAAMYSPLARIALGTETRGQNSWLNYGPHGASNRTAATEDTVFAPQKLGVLPHWVHHEGAEDFIRPHEQAQMQDIYRKNGFRSGGVVSAALGKTRGFTKNGASAMLTLKMKG